MLQPENNNILVEIEGSYDLIATPDQKYDTKTKGICIAVANPKHKEWIGKQVYFKSYEDDTEVEEDGKTLAFIEAKYVKGSKDVEAK